MGSLFNRLHFHVLYYSQYETLPLNAISDLIVFGTQYSNQFSKVSYMYVLNIVLAFGPNINVQKVMCGVVHRMIIEYSSVVFEPTQATSLTLE